MKKIYLVLDNGYPYAAFDNKQAALDLLNYLKDDGNFSLGDCSMFANLDGWLDSGIGDDIEL